LNDESANYIVPTTPSFDRLSPTDSEWLYEALLALLRMDS